MPPIRPIVFMRCVVAKFGRYDEPFDLLANLILKRYFSQTLLWTVGNILGMKTATILGVLMISNLALAEAVYRPPTPLPSRAFTRIPASEPAAYRTSAVGPRAENSEATSWWSPENQRYSIGYENGTGNFNIFGRNAVSLSHTFAPNRIVDIYLGYTKNADTITVGTSTADTALTNTRTITTSYGGVGNAHVITLGAGYRSVLYQNAWVQIHAGIVGALVLPFSAKYNNGSFVETFPNKDDADNRTIADTVGSVESREALSFQVGPRIGSEFYVKWFPHLALGFSTGIITAFGGNTKTTTVVRTKNYTVANGQEQLPTTDNTTTTVSESRVGMRGTTFGIGGTIFNLFGNFSLRYIW